MPILDAAVSRQAGPLADSFCPPGWSLASARSGVNAFRDEANGCTGGMLSFTAEHDTHLAAKAPRGCVSDHPWSGLLCHLRARAFPL